MIMSNVTTSEYTASCTNSDCKTGSHVHSSGLIHQGFCCSTDNCNSTSTVKQSFILIMLSFLVFIL
jgi:hypothetical protein